MPPRLQRTRLEHHRKPNRQVNRWLPGRPRQKRLRRHAPHFYDHRCFAQKTNRRKKSFKIQSYNHRRGPRTRYWLNFYKFIGSNVSITLHQSEFFDRLERGFFLLIPCLFPSFCDSLLRIDYTVLFLFVRFQALFSFLRQIQREASPVWWRRWIYRRDNLSVLL